jgi:serine/threonine protein kinase
MTVVSTPEQMVGAVLAGRYRLVGCIGAGPVGVVFEAHDLHEGGPCAIKTLRAGAAEPTAIVDAFMRDTRAARHLVHPNIALCHDTAVAADGAPYRVMDLLDGAPLSAYLTPGLAYDTRHVLPIASAALSALGEAHERYVVHGDFKPSNVFMARNGEAPPLVKVLDFGMAGVLQLRRSTAGPEATPTAVEAVGYLSPEQRAGDSACARDDLWALAVVLYRLLTGHGPTAVSGVRRAGAAASEPNLAYLGQPHLAVWRGFFANAFAPSVGARFSSAAEMKRELATIEASLREARSLAPLASTTDLSPEFPALSSQRSSAGRVDVLARARAVPEPTSLDATMPGADPPVVPRPPAEPIRFTAYLLLAVAVLLGFAAGFVAARY